MKLTDTPEHWPVVSSTQELDDWLISVRADQVRMPGERIAKRVVVTHPGAVAILAMDEASRVLMVRQYRHPVGGLLWEIPAGLLDHDGEPPVDAARRELREETGYAADSWRPLIEFYSSPGFSTERVGIFLAKGVSELADRGYVPHDEEATMEVRWVPLADAVQAVLAGGIHNGTTIVAILAAHAITSAVGPPAQDGGEYASPGDA